MWTGDVSNSWSDEHNWFPKQVPVDGDTADFTGSAQSLTCNIDESTGIASIIMDSSWSKSEGTINVEADLTVTGDFTMVGGIFGGNGAVSIGGSGSTWTGGGQIDLGNGGFTNTGTLTLGSTDVAYGLGLAGPGTLTNNGTINVVGGTVLGLTNGASLDNVGGFDFTGDGSISESGGGTLTNTGTLEKTGGTGNSFLNVTTFNNTDGRDGKDRGCPGHRGPQPAAVAALPPAGLIHVGRLASDVVTQFSDHGVGGGGRLGGRGADLAGADGDAEHVGTKGFDLALAQAVVPGHQGQDALQAGALAAGGHPRGQPGAGGGSASGAGQAVKLVLGHFGPDLRQLQHLVAERLRVFPAQRVAAPAAARRLEAWVWSAGNRGRCWRPCPG
jgi:hypothetical protein